MRGASGRLLRGWGVAAVFAAAATALPAAPLSGDELPVDREVERIEVKVEAEPVNPHACEIRCGVKRYRTECRARATPVCQCEYAPFARCSDPEKRKPARR